MSNSLLVHYAVPITFFLIGCAAAVSMLCKRSKRRTLPPHARLAPPPHSASVERRMAAVLDEVFYEKQFACSVAAAFGIDDSGLKAKSPGIQEVTTPEFDELWKFMIRELHGPGYMVIHFARWNKASYCEITNSGRAWLRAYIEKGDLTIRT